MQIISIFSITPFANSLTLHCTPFNNTLLLNRSLIWEKAFRPFMEERESKRKARERDQSASNASEKYTQVSVYLFAMPLISFVIFSL